MSFITFFKLSRNVFQNLTVGQANRFLPLNKRRLQAIARTTAIISAGNSDGDNNGHYYQHKSNAKRMSGINGVAFASAAFSFGFFGDPKQKEETPEEKLVSTIKRSILCIENEQYEKAEQILHMALRMAQDIQSREGITYVYDLMANLAMERDQFKKAEKLFADVMKRLLSDGLEEDSPQILHISSKMAHMAQMQGELDKALLGFQWTLSKIEENLKKVPEDKDVQELFGLTKNWFGQLLIKQGRYLDAKKMFEEAYECLVDVYGRINEAAVTVLNNLSVVCMNLDDFEQAKTYLVQALELVRELKDVTQEGVLQANLGLIYLREGLIHQAKENCSLAYRIGKRHKNPDAIEQAEYCLNEIKSYNPSKE